MTVGRAKLDEKEELAIAALLSTRTHAEAAAKAGVSESTLTRWLRQGPFALAYRQARRAVMDGVISTLQKAGSRAVETLEAGLGSANDAVRIRAAQLILEHGFKGLEVFDLMARVEELEQVIAEIRNGVESTDEPADETARGSEDPGREPPRGNQEPRV